MKRAAVVHAFGKPLTIEKAPIPTAGAGEVLIKLMAKGVCRTDLHAADGDWAGRPPLPFIPGHEGAGAMHRAPQRFLNRQSATVSAGRRSRTPGPG